MRNLVAEGLTGTQLPLVQKNLDGAVFVQEGEGEGEGVERDVAPADVQEPGDAVGRTDQSDVRTGFLDLLGHARTFVVAALAGIDDIKRVDRRDRHRRLARPDRIDGVLVEGDQLGAGLVAGLFVTFDLGFDMQVRIEGQTLASG